MHSNASKRNLPAAARRVAIFVDGLARAMVLPFGPRLVHRLVYGGEMDPSQTILMPLYMSLLVAIYILGRYIGTRMTPTSPLTTTKVARLGGVALALHIFTYGAGLKSFVWLFIIRFLSATIAGLLIGTTRHVRLPVPGEAVKLYLIGFSISILHGGLLFKEATHDSVMQNLTGESSLQSPLFLVTVAVAAQVVLRLFFTFCTGGSSNILESQRIPFRHVPLRTRVASQDRVLPATSPDKATSPASLDDAASFGSSIIASPPIHGPYSPIHEATSREEEDDRDTERDIPRRDPLEYSGRRYSYASRSSVPVVTPARSRIGSHASEFTIDDFYDCHSVLSDVEFGFDDLDHSDRERLQQVCEYRDNKCVYADGNPAYIPNGDSESALPECYLDFYNGDEARAVGAYRKTQDWRMNREVWNIHCRPHPWFAKIKEAYPHFVHGHSKFGYPIVYEQPGKMNLKELFRNGCKIDDMVNHYTYFMEFLSNRICSRDDVRRLQSDVGPHSSSTWGMMVVMDVKGAGLSSLSGDVVKYLKQAGDINSAHYPLSMKRAFVVKSPFWLAGAWSGIKGILPESVQVDILSESKYLAALREFVDEDQIPPEYGGLSPYKLGEHPYEVELRRLVKSGRSDDIEVSLSTEFSSEAPSRGVESLLMEPSCSDVAEDEKPESQRSLLSPPRNRQVRRRGPSADHGHLGFGLAPSTDRKGKRGAIETDKDIFFFVSAIHVIWHAIQGAIELILPIWMLASAKYGGVGCSPSRSGVAMFCACLVLLSIMRTKLFNGLVSQMPGATPIRAFRIGAGSEATLFILLPTAVSMVE